MSQGGGGIVFKARFGNSDGTVEVAVKQSMNPAKVAPPPSTVNLTDLVLLAPEIARAGQPFGTKKT